MINPKEAPKGYEAVEGKCTDCDLFNEKCDLIECAAESRKDGEDVIFKKKT